MAEEKVHNGPDWPIGRIATQVILFTLTKDSSLETVMRLFHGSIEVVDPNENPKMAGDYKIRALPTIVFMWRGQEIKRLETNITQ